MENEFIDRLVENGTRVIMYTSNGAQLRGTILRHDDYVLVLYYNLREHLVYKQAISTIVRDD